MLPSPDGVWPIKSGSSENDSLHLSSQTHSGRVAHAVPANYQGRQNVCSLDMLQMYTGQLLVLAGEWKVQREQFRC